MFYEFIFRLLKIIFLLLIYNLKHSQTSTIFVSEWIDQEWRLILRNPSILALDELLFFKRSFLTNSASLPYKSSFKDLGLTVSGHGETCPLPLIKWEDSVLFVLPFFERSQSYIENDRTYLWQPHRTMGGPLHPERNFMFFPCPPILSKRFNAHDPINKIFLTKISTVRLFNAFVQL